MRATLGRAQGRHDPRVERGRRGTAPWHQGRKTAASGLDAAPSICIEPLPNHIRRCTRRKQHVRPARARANNASHHEKRRDMWLGDRRGGSDERDKERLQSCGPSIMCNVYAIVVYPSQRVQLQVEVGEQDYLRQSKASVANGKICFTCPNLRQAVEQGCASCASQTLKAASGHLLPNANQVVAARSGASGP